MQILQQTIQYKHTIPLYKHLFEQSMWQTSLHKGSPNLNNNKYFISQLLKNINHISSMINGVIGISIQDARARIYS